MKTTGTIGYAAMFEQFHPTGLLEYCKMAEESGFTSVMASTTFIPGPRIRARAPSCGAGSEPLAPPLTYVSVPA